MALAIAEVHTPKCLAISAIGIPNSELTRYAILALALETFLLRPPMLIPVPVTWTGERNSVISIAIYNVIRYNLNYRRYQTDEEAW